MKMVRTGFVDSVIRVLVACSLGLLSFVPSAFDPPALLLIVSLAFYAVNVCFRVRRLFLISSYGFLVLFFVAYLFFINSIVAFINGRDVDLFFRGVVPFLFFLFFLIFWNDEQLTDQSAYDLVWLSSVFWLFSLIVFNFFDVLRVLSGELARLSYVVSDVLIPFGMIGFVLTLYKKNINKLLRFCLLLAFGGLVVLSGYRSQVLMLMVVVLFYLRVWKSFWGLFLAGLVFTVLVALYLSGFPVVEALVNRMAGSAGDSVRSAELSFAFSQLFESPIFGKGLAVPVPLELTRPEHVAGLFEKESVPYIHNFLGYFLMNSGVIGGVGIVLILFLPLYVSFKSWIEEGGARSEGVLVIFGLLIAFFLVSAAFRQIQMVVVVALLACCSFKKAKLKAI
ncbi:hypothetical protein [Microbulbifer epialgicus]|uniref:O-antigen ligase n=1 Tax=Microbulbifer epialgicus TaxID=393907 RepID=A0ABV4P3Q1_9GAMM